MVDKFNWLGTVFSYTDRFSLNQEHLAGKALNSIMYCKTVHCPYSTASDVWLFIGAIHSYKSKIWGYTKQTKLERINVELS